jgi:DNA-binding NarL/FixJ family response regulator
VGTPCHDVTKVRLIVISGATLVHLGVSASLAAVPDLALVGSASSAAQARDLCARREADVVLVEAHLPGEEPLALAAELRQARPGRGVVLLAPDDDEWLLQALAAGISAYLPASSPVELLLATLRHAAASPSSFTAPNLARALHRRSTGQQLLSPREGEVLARLRDGSSLSAIAQALLVSESTIKTYVARLYDKLGVRNRKQALEVATRAGLLP